MKDQLSEIRLQQVHPKLKGLVESMDISLELKGIEIRVVQGLRTWAEQQALYEQGRTTGGHIVTNAKPGESWHTYGCAVDLIPGLRDKPDWTPNWEPTSPDFKTMISTGEGLGLVSGSTWDSIKDYPHFQLAGLPITPTEEMSNYLQVNGVEAFWKEYVQ